METVKIADIRRLKELGLTRAAIARELGVSRPRIARIADQHGIESIRRSRRSTTAERMERLGRQSDLAIERLRVTLYRLGESRRSAGLGE